MSQQSTMSQCQSYRQPWKSFISKSWKKLLLIPALLVTLLCFSAFAAPQAHAASVSGHNLSGSKVAQDCMVNTNENDTSTYTLILWKDVCSGGEWAEIIAKVPGTFGLSLYGDGYLLASNSDYLYTGGYIYTSEFYNYSVYTTDGAYYG